MANAPNLSSSSGSPPPRSRAGGLRRVAAALRSYMQAIIDLLGKEDIAAFLGVVVTMVLGFMVARWTFFRHQSKMKRGEFLGQLLVQSHALLPDHEGNPVLCFTTEKVYPDLSELFPNPALQKLFLERARATTEENPLMDLSGHADHAKRTLVSHLSSVVEGLGRAIRSIDHPRSSGRGRTQVDSSVPDQTRSPRSASHLEGSPAHPCRTATTLATYSQSALGCKSYP